MRIFYRRRLLKAALAVLVGTLTLSYALLRRVEREPVPSFGSDARRTAPRGRRRCSSSCSSTAPSTACAPWQSPRSSPALADRSFDELLREERAGRARLRCGGVAELAAGACREEPTGRARCRHSTRAVYGGLRRDHGCLSWSSGRGRLRPVSRGTLMEAARGRPRRRRVTSPAVMVALGGRAHARAGPGLRVARASTSLSGPLPGGQRPDHGRAGARPPRRRAATHGYAPRRAGGWRASPRRRAGSDRAVDSWARTSWRRRRTEIREHGGLVRRSSVGAGERPRGAARDRPAAVPGRSRGELARSTLRSRSTGAIRSTSIGRAARIVRESAGRPSTNATRDGDFAAARRRIALEKPRAACMRLSSPFSSGSRRRARRLGHV